MKKLKTIAQRKKWNMILGISDIIMMIIASYLALLTRFEFYPSQIAPIFLKNAAKYMPLNLFCSIVIFRHIDCIQRNGSMQESPILLMSLKQL